MIRLSLLLLLSGCTAAGASVDRAGYAIPDTIDTGKRVVIHRVDDPAALDPHGRDLYAFAKPDGAVCHVFIRRDEPDPLIVLHELRHCGGWMH